MKVAERTAQAHEAMRRAFEAHYVSLLRLGMALSGRTEMSEDLVQEAFVRSAQHLSRLPAEEVGLYLRRVLVNLWRDRLRRLAIELKHLPGEWKVPLDPTAPYDEREALWRRLMRLPDRQRACLVLRYYEGLSEAEVAAVLRCSVGTVKSQTSRALAKLRKEIPDED